MPAETMIGTGQVALTIPAKAEYIAVCRLALTGLARLRELEDEVIADLKLALTEACSNSIRHGYPDGPGSVLVRYELTPDRLAVEVSDEGPGFAGAPGQGDEDGRDEGGLGIAIIRALVDELEIGPGTDERGSRLRFVKYVT